MAKYISLSKAYNLIDSNDSFDDNIDFVVKKRLGVGKWSSTTQIVFYNKKEKQFYAFTYEQGLAETQPNTINVENYGTIDLYDDVEEDFVEIHPVTKKLKVITIYE